MKVLYYKIVPIDSFFFFLKVPLEVDYFIRTRMTEPYKFMKENDHTSRLPKTYKFKTHLFLKKKRKRKRKKVQNPLVSCPSPLRIYLYSSFRGSESALKKTYFYILFQNHGTCQGNNLKKWVHNIFFFAYH